MIIENTLFRVHSILKLYKVRNYRSRACGKTYLPSWQCSMFGPVSQSVSATCEIFAARECRPPRQPLLVFCTLNL